MPVGTVLGERYLVQDTLGRGGMGQVYLARDQRSGLEVAVKTADLGLCGPAQREALLDGFRREGQTLLRLQHSNLPAFLDYFEDDEHAFLVMELIPGRNLVELVDDEGPLDDGRVRQYLERLASVLDYLHGQKPPVIFRDLKPANVMLTPEGDLKLIDFGLAKSLPNSGMLTQTSARGLVSPGFAAPEQYSGGTDERSDLHALGATAYFLATGQIPPESVERATSSVGLPSPDRLNPAISPGTALLITRLMSLRRDRRPASAREVLEGLRRTSGEVETQPVGPARRKRRLWPPMVVVCILLAFGGWYYGAFVGPRFPLAVESSPAGASVSLDGRADGVTPCNVSVRKRTAIRLERPGFAPVADRVMQTDARRLFWRLQPGEVAAGVADTSLPGYTTRPQWAPRRDICCPRATGRCPEWPTVCRQIGSFSQRVPRRWSCRTATAARGRGGWPVSPWTGTALFPGRGWSCGCWTPSRAGSPTSSTRTDPSRAAAVVRDGRRLSLEFTPCQDVYEFVKTLDVLRGCFGWAVRRRGRG